MKRFQPGTFARDEMPEKLRKFSPTAALEHLEDVDLETLWAAGKRLILLDVDNTLLPWRSYEVPEATHAWLDRARAIGFRFCILSNTRRPERLEQLASEMSLEYVRAKFKPSREMYQLALEQFQCRPDEAVMIGDQLMTDVLGANRSDIDAIWIKPMASREFIGTRLVSRTVERIIGRFLYRYFQAEDDNDPGPPKRSGLFQHNVVRQFAKFCVVGGSSTVIDLGLHFLLMFIIPWGGQPLGTALGSWLIATFPAVFAGAAQPAEAAFPVLKVLTAGIAILNGFYWNRRWTFQIKDPTHRLDQLRKYVTVALTGLLLNSVIASMLFNIVPGHPKRSWAVANAIATIVVAFWNFGGQRLWAFRRRS